MAGSSTAQGTRRQRAHREAVRGRGRTPADRRRRTLGAATRRGTARTESGHGVRWQHGACGDVELKDCRVPVDNLLGAEAQRLGSRRCAPHRAGRGAQSRHRPRRLRGRARLRACACQGGRRIIEHQAIGSKLAEIAIRLEVARNGIWQAAWALRPPRGGRRPQPPRPAARTHRAGVRGGGDLSRHQGRRRMLRRHGRDARHAAAEIRARRARLPAFRRRAPTTAEAAHRRSAGRLSPAPHPAAARGCEPIEGDNPWTSC